MGTKAISVKRLWEEVGYRPHAVQRRIHMAKVQSRFRVTNAGRRTGKSTLGGHELTTHAMEAFYKQNQLDKYGRRMEYWIVGPEYSDSEKEFRVLYNDLTKLEFDFDRPGTYYDVHGGNMHISLFDGKFQVHAKSAKYPDQLVGESLDGVILAEAAKLKPNIWSKYIRPMLADYRGWGLMTSTPEGKNWFYEAWKLGQDPIDTEWWSTRMPSWTNDILFPEGRYDPEILSMAKGMSEEKFNQEIGADFTEFVGRVFKEFDEETHVGDFVYDPRLPLYVAADFGFTNPFVLLFIQVDIWGTVYIIREFYKRNMTADEVAEDVKLDPILAALSRSVQVLYPDPEDPAAAKTLCSKLKWRRSAANTGGPLKDRIDLIRRWVRVPVDLRHPDTRPENAVPRLFVDRTCVNTIREMQDYKYPDTNTDQQNEKENPMKKDDHAPEALGRFFKGHFGVTTESAGVRQSRARTTA